MPQSLTIKLLLVLVGMLFALVVAVCAAAMPDGASSHWSDRCRRGVKAFGATLTVYAVVVGLLITLGHA